MRVNLDLSEDVLNKLEKMAKDGKRNRKNFMEYILENFSERGNLVWADEEKDKAVFEPNSEGRFNFKKYPERREEFQEPVSEEEFKSDIIKDYSYYDAAARKVSFDNAEELIIEIMAAPIKIWQKDILKKMINARFPQP